MTFEERKTIMGIVRSLPPETAFLLESLVRWVSIRNAEANLDMEHEGCDAAYEIFAANEVCAGGRILRLVDKLIACGAAAKLIDLARVMGDDE